MNPAMAVAEKYEELRLSKPLFGFFGVRLCLYVILVGGPLAFGCVQPWAWGAMTLLTLAALLLWVHGCLQRRSVAIVWSPLYIPAALVGILCVLQLGWLSLDPIGTREAAIKFVCYLLVFFLTQQLFHRAPTRIWKQFAVGASIFGFAFAVFSIIQFLATPGAVYGFKPRWGGYIFGSYISHNNYAGFMEMLLPFPLALFAAFWKEQRAKAILSFFVCVIVSSVFLSGSRAGSATVVLEIALFLYLLLHLQPSCSSRSRVCVTTLILLAALALCCRWLDPGNVWQRWETMAESPDVAAATRLDITKDCFRISHDYIGGGIGLGAFERVYPRYQSVVTDLGIDFAHNDYAQFLAETGLVGWIVVPVSVLMFLRCAFQDVRKRCMSPEGWVQIGAALGVIGVLAHSLFDFNLHIPANAAWFAVEAAMATSILKRFKAPIQPETDRTVGFETLSTQRA